MNIRATFRTFGLASLAAASVYGSTATSVIAWTRGSTSVDIAMDEACDSLVDSLGRYVVVGSSIQPNGTRKGCITIFNRNRSIARVIEIARPGGGDLMFHLVRQQGSKFYVAANAKASGESFHNELRFITVDQDLMQPDMAALKTFPSGTQVEPTDLEVDVNGNAFIGGLEQATQMAKSFVHRVPAGGNAFSANIAGIDCMVGSKPQIELKGIIAVLIGMVTTQGPLLRSYTPEGGLNWSLGGSNPAAWSPEIAMGISEAGALLDWIQGIGPSSTNLDAHVQLIDTSTGEIEWAEVYNPGNGTVTPRGISEGQGYGKRLNALFDYQAVGSTASTSRFVSYDGELNQTAEWVSPFPVLESGKMAIDSFAEAYFAARRPGANATGVNLSASNTLSFSWSMPQTGFFDTYEQGTDVHSPSGDVFTMRSDGERFQVVCVQQSAVAISDFYSPKSGKFFRPVNPVTSNDRYAAGATITVTQPPLHGTLTMGANGIFNYTSAQGYVGPDSFKYRLTKPNLDPTSATVNLNVRP